MRKSLIAAALFVGLLAFAASAFALPITFDVAGLTDKTLRAQVTADYNPLTATASFSILNTTTTRGLITGFAFSLPADGAGYSITGASSSNPNFHLLNSLGGIVPDRIDSPQLSGNLDVGLGTGPNFAGGSPNKGIQIGQTATFNLIFSGTGVGGWSTSSILAALAQEADPLFAVRFQGTGHCGFDSDVATPTPIPPAVWLLGSGFLGLMGFRRSRLAA